MPGKHDRQTPWGDGTNINYHTPNLDEIPGHLCPQKPVKPPPQIETKSTQKTSRFPIPGGTDTKRLNLSVVQLQDETLLYIFAKLDDEKYLAYKLANQPFDDDGNPSQFVNAASPGVWVSDPSVRGNVVVLTQYPKQRPPVVVFPEPSVNHQPETRSQ